MLMGNLMEASYQRSDIEGLHIVTVNKTKIQSVFKL